MSVRSRSPLTLLAHAYRLTDPTLTHHGISADSDRARIAALLERESPYLEPIAAEDAVRESFESAPTAKQVLADLCDALIAIEDGRPVLRSAAVAPLLVSTLDPDFLALVTAHRIWGLQGAWEEEEILGWPTLLRQQRGSFDDIFRHRVADTHVHLGGAVPTGMRWMTALSSTGPVSGLGVDNGVVALVWAQRLEFARGCLVELARLARDGPAAGAEGRATAKPTSCDAATLVAALRGFWPLAPENYESDPPELSHSVSLGHVVPERALLASGLSTTALFEKLVLPYVRIRNSFHRAVVLRPGGRGLARFRNTLRRGTTTWTQREAVQRARLHLISVLESYLSNIGGHSDPKRAAEVALNLELRATMPFRGDRLRDLILGWAMGAADTLRRWNYPAIRLGMVFHLSRSVRRDEPASAARAAHRARHESLFSWLTETGVVRPWIVGVDAAGDELAAPPRDFIAAFADLRKRVDGQRPDAHPRIRLGFTFHAGEDFRDVTTGIRHVHETSELLALRPGDRIGHGLALFWNAADFYQTRPRAQPRLDEHLLDLLWMTAVFNEVGEDACMRMARDRLISHLIGLDVVHATDRVTRLALRLRLERELQTMSEDALLDELGVDQRSVRRLHPLRIDTTWLQLVETVRDAAKCDVRRKGLYIEVNPTSNLLVGGFRDYRDLSYLKEYAITPDQLPERIPITLNTDDPGVFQTTLTNEYCQVGLALLELGLTRGQVWEWLDHVRRTTVRSCFIPAEAPSGKDLHDYFVSLLDEDEQLRRRKVERRE